MGSIVESGFLDMGSIVESGFVEKARRQHQVETCTLQKGIHDACEGERVHGLVAPATSIAHNTLHKRGTVLRPFPLRLSAFKYCLWSCQGCGTIVVFDFFWILSLP
jgi:hypothetical protein